jgi:hypothetical protein
MSEPEIKRASHRPMGQMTQKRMSEKKQLLQKVCLQFDLHFNF